MICGRKENKFDAATVTTAATTTDTTAAMQQQQCNSSNATAAMQQQQCNSSNKTVTQQRCDNAATQQQRDNKTAPPLHLQMLVHPQDATAATTPTTVLAK
eukprot:g8741.t1 g8741   contig33:120791-121090(+)